MKSIKKELENFSAMPDIGYVQLSVVMAVLGVSRSTVLRACDKGILPKPVKISERLNGWNVKALREYLAEKAGA